MVPSNRLFDNHTLCGADWCLKRRMLDKEIAKLINKDPDVNPPPPSSKTTIGPPPIIQLKPNDNIKFVREDKGYYRSKEKDGELFHKIALKPQVYTSKDRLE